MYRLAPLFELTVLRGIPRRRTPISVVTVVVGFCAVGPASGAGQILLTPLDAPYSF